MFTPRHRRPTARIAARIAARFDAQLAASLVVLSLAAPAAAAQAAAPELEIASCVSGSPPLRVAATAERAVLEAIDGQRFEAAAQVRYPLYQRAGLRPQQVLMLRRGGLWLYVTLQRHGGPAPCFTAVFAASRFEFTDDWLRKYRPQPGEAMD